MIKLKQPGKLSGGVVHIQENAHPHMANGTQIILNNSSGIPSIISDNPIDMSPFNFDIFAELKKTLGGQTFQMDDFVKKPIWKVFL